MRGSKIVLDWTVLPEMRYLIGCEQALSSCVSCDLVHSFDPLERGISCSFFLPHTFECRSLSKG